MAIITLQAIIFVFAGNLLLLPLARTVMQMTMMEEIRIVRYQYPKHVRTDVDVMLVHGMVKSVTILMEEGRRGGKDG
jgi:Na+-translocating ferredoxin:NAD+ oxidoreductase RnfE subunit